MGIKDQYLKQVRLLLEVLPYVLKEKCFALKGGTAINLFFRDMPRFSVDIDLVYLPVEDREASLNGIHEALKRVGQKIEKHLSGAKVKEVQLKDPIIVSKIFVTRNDVLIKVEPNFVMRGSVFPLEERVLSVRAQKMFEVFVTARTVSFGDVFGGKICAALDRQHPRDLYDIKILLENEGLTEQVRKGFIIHWLAHDRPMHELLMAMAKDIKADYDSAFLGMENDLVSYEDLLKVGQMLRSILRDSLTQDEKEFLISFKSMDPQWHLLGVEGVKDLPAIRWKQMNIARMDKVKRDAFILKLKVALGM